ncbi:MAG: FG-GAP-like repeat-containing protein [Polaribacter sp.]|uniref:FG-GAP-like repeat-containing protein n=1 Tax=Polaribacter sp. TaxID=1920175 RepID=UPI002F35B6CD
MKLYISILSLLFSFNISAQLVEKANEVGVDHLFNDLANMGGGALFFDFNNDGWEDLYINGGLVEDSLYKNKGDGTFEKTNNTGLSITGNYNTLAVVSGDVNNDGFRDLFVTTWRGTQNIGNYTRNLLFINNGDETFTESGTSWGLTEESFSTGASMLDYNNDGFLDIYVINYQKNASVIRDENDEVIGFDHDCFEDFFYENNGDNTFTEKATALGINNNGCGLAVMPTDYNKDHNQDIYVANDFGEFITPNTLYKNNSSGASFTNVSQSTNTDVGVYAMGISSADIDKDEDFDYYISNVGRNVLLKNDGNNVFTNISSSAGVENTYSLDGGGLFSTSWGTAFLDINNDTWPDLFVANGRIPAAPFIGTGEKDPNYLFTNNGNSTFTQSKVSVDDKNKGRGMAYSDYDKDGDLDVIVVVLKGSTSDNPKTTFFQNQLNPDGTDGKNWVQFELEGQTINKDAIGAKVILTVNGEKLIQEVHGQGSHASQHSLVLHFGLANNVVITEVEIQWSATSKQTFTNVNGNKRYQLKEGGTLNLDTNTKSVHRDIRAYPNPVNKDLFIKNIIEKSTLVIRTLDGKILIKKSISIDENINTSNFSSGIYLINIYNKNQNYNQLIIKK